MTDIDKEALMNADGPTPSTATYTLARPPSCPALMATTSPPVVMPCTDAEAAPAEYAQPPGSVITTAATDPSVALSLLETSGAVTLLTASGASKICEPPSQAPAQPPGQ